jgi:methyl-accepting chemotaxis protein
MRKVWRVFYRIIEAILVKKIRPLLKKMSTLIGYSEIGIRKKFLIAFLSISVIPLVIIGVILYLFASVELMSGAKDNLKAIGEKKAKAVENFFDDCLADLTVLGEMATNTQRRALHDLENLRDQMILKVKQYLQSRMTYIEVMSEDPTFYRAMVAFTTTTIPNGELWKSLAIKYGPWITFNQETYGFKNIYLISKSGRIVYSVEKTSELEENLETGPLKNSPAGKAFQKGLQTAALQDFEPYQPLENAPTGFVSAPIKAGGTVIGVVMGQIDLVPINRIMNQHDAFTAKTEAHILAKVGRKIQMRTQRKSSGRNREAPYNNYILDRAFYGESGSDTEFDSNGVYKYVSYAPINLPGIKWAINVSTPVEYVFTYKYPDARTDWLTHFKENESFVNLALISPEGFLFYSVLHQDDYHTNLFNGPYKESHLGRFINQTSFTRRMLVSDFQKYAPSNNFSTGFAGLPILKNDKILFTIVVQIPTSVIQKIMEEPTGLGRSGETFIVGSDNLWRTEARFIEDIKADSMILNPAFKMNDRIVNQTISGASITRNYKNYRGEKVLSISSPVTLQGPNTYNPNGVKWAIFSEMEMSEIRAPIIRLAWICFLTLLIISLIVVTLSFLLSEGLMQQIDHIRHLFSKIRIGNYNARAKVVSKDELGHMTESLNAMLDDTLVLIHSREERDTMRMAVVQLLEKTKALADGDLTVRAEATEHLTGAIAEFFNTMAKQLSEIIKEVKDATFRVGRTSNQIGEFTGRLASISAQQSGHVDKAISVMTNIGNSAQKILEEATQSAAVSDQSIENIQGSDKIVENTILAITHILERTQKTALVIKRLGENLQTIGNIIQTINNISDKTSVLSLNASIQAAAAEKPGHGLAKAAEEIQHLAEKSGLSTQQIEVLINNIREDIQAAGDGLDHNIDQIITNLATLDDVRVVLREMESASVKITQAAHSIAHVSEEQKLFSGSAAKTIMAVGEFGTQTVKTSRQIALSMQILSKISDQLRVSVETFKVEDRKTQKQNKDQLMTKPEEEEEDQKVKMAQP